MITDTSNDYQLFLPEREADRLDFLFNHPDLQPIRNFRNADTIPLGLLITEPQYGVCETGLADGAIGFLNVQHITSNGEIVFDLKKEVAA